MKKFSIILCAVVLFSLVLSPVAGAAWSKMWTDLCGVTYTNATNLVGLDSLSDVRVNDSLGNLDSATDITDPVNTSASATIFDAIAHAETATLDVSAKSQATPPPLVWSGAYAHARQIWTFQATADGLVTYNATFDYTFDLMTEYPTEGAGGGIQAFLDLYSPLWTNVQRDYLEDIKLVFDGDDFFFTGSTTLSVTSPVPFSAGEIGYVIIDVSIGAEAYSYSVPSPSAILLVGMGTTIVGWLRRRKAIV
jgi:hypothetical protein